MFANRRMISTAAVLCMGALGGSVAHAALIYRNTFDSATATTSAASITPGGGTLGVTNSTNGGVKFTATGGISGGVLDATTGQTYGTGDPAGYAGTPSANGGSALTGLPNSGAVSSFTITFWVKGSAAGLNAANFPRLFILGASGTTDTATNTFAVQLRSGKLDVIANNVTSGSNTSVGNTLVANTWNFIAITYDGTSSTGFNSTVQATLTGDAKNAQLYEGTDTTAVSRFGVADTTSDFNTSSGTLQFGANAVLLMANRTNLGRGFNGLLDDFRIYDSVLSPTQVDAVRTSVLPEPTTGGLVFLSLGALLRRRRT